MYFQSLTRNIPTSSCLKITCKACRTQSPLQQAAALNDPDIPLESRDASVEAVKIYQDTHQRFTSVWGIIITVISALGILLCLFLMLYFSCLSPAVQGSALVGYFLLFGLMLLFALNFAFVAAPCEATCGIRRFFLGTVYAIIFACMLVKSLNIWRKMQYEEKQPVGYSFFSRPCGLLVVTLGIALVQILIAGEWLILARPAVGTIDGEPRCQPAATHEDELVFSCVFVMLLIFLTTLFSLMSWNSHENSRESRFVAIACVFSIVVWLIWTIVATRCAYAYRDLTICIANIIEGYVIMLCIFMRKVYVLFTLRKLEKSESKQAMTEMLYNQPLALTYPELSESKSQLGYDGGSQFATSLPDQGPPMRALMPPPRPDSMMDYDGGSQFSPGYPLPANDDFGPGPGYLYLTGPEAHDADVAV